MAFLFLVHYSVMFFIGDLNEWDMRCPYDSFSDITKIPILEFFLQHLLSQNKMLAEVIKPNTSFIICLPISTTPDVKGRLIDLLFTKFKVARICLVSKAQAVTKVLGLNTCIVVDSGANNTVLSVIVNGRIYQTRHIPAGKT